MGELTSMYWSCTCHRKKREIERVWCVHCADEHMLAAVQSKHF